MRKRRSHKYGAVVTHYGGRSYASKGEAKRAAELDLFQRADEIVGWEPQVRIQLCPAFRCVIDFVVEDEPGKFHAEDVKGYEAPRWRDVVKHWRFGGTMPLVVLRSRGRSWNTELILPRSMSEDDVSHIRTASLE